MNIYSREITIYKNMYDTRGRRKLLSDFLLDHTHDSRVLQLRDNDNPAERAWLKKQLPQATISGVFSPTRCASNLVKHSGLLCIDIDGKENPHLHDMDKVKNEVLSGIRYIAYASLSVSGNGLFAIIPIEHPDKHRQHFEQLRRDFKARGITIDSACGDVSRLRCMSFDMFPLVNPDVELYTGLYHEKPRPAGNHAQREAKINDTLALVSHCCQQIAQRHIDITGGYQQWFMIGAALAQLGEQGREYFHIVSSQSVQYNYAETDRKFTELLRRPAKHITVSSFFFFCSQHGVTYREYMTKK